MAGTRTPKSRRPPRRQTEQDERHGQQRHEPAEQQLHQEQGHAEDRPSSQNTSRNGSRTTQKMAFRMAVNTTITATIATPNSSSAPSCDHRQHVRPRADPWRAASLTSGLRGNRRRSSGQSRPRPRWTSSVVGSVYWMTPCFTSSIAIAFELVGAGHRRSSRGKAPRRNCLARCAATSTNRKRLVMGTAG